MFSAECVSWFASSVFIHDLSSWLPWVRAWTTWMESILCLGKWQKAWTSWPKLTRPLWTKTLSHFRISGETRQTSSGAYEVVACAPIEHLLFLRNITSYNELSSCCRINHTVILDDPFDDPPDLPVPDRSPEPTKEQLDVSAVPGFIN